MNAKAKQNLIDNLKKEHKLADSPTMTTEKRRKTKKH
jgi:hypothetical protein